jgi:hypothetical protein
MAHNVHVEKTGNKLVLTIDISPNAVKAAPVGNGEKGNMLLAADNDRIGLPDGRVVRWNFVAHFPPAKGK